MVDIGRNPEQFREVHFAKDVRPCTRYKEIEVDYWDQNFQPQHGKYTGWTAQIIQHELDHVAGIVI